MLLHLNRANNIVDGDYRPLATGLTIAAAARFLAAHEADLPMFLEAHFRVEPLAPVSVERQLATHVRRVKAIAAGCGRIVSRVEPRVINGYRMDGQYVAFLAR